MITEQDLKEAIAECQGERDPNASTCIKLAAFYIILDHMYDTPPQHNSGYSFSAPPVSGNSKGIDYSGQSEFAGAIRGKDPNDVWPVIDELMSTVNIINPGLYSGVLRKLST